jgi:hypothetical protein
VTSCSATLAPNNSTENSRTCLETNLLPGTIAEGSGSRFFAITPRTIAITNASMTARSIIDFSTSAMVQAIAPMTRQIIRPAEFFLSHVSPPFCLSISIALMREERTTNIENCLMYYTLTEKINA